MEEEDAFVAIVECKDETMDTLQTTADDVTVSPSLYGHNRGLADYTVHGVQIWMQQS